MMPRGLGEYWVTVMS
jgi:hypothetical protein